MHRELSSQRESKEGKGVAGDADFSVGPGSIKMPLPLNGELGGIGDAQFFLSSRHHHLLTEQVAILVRERRRGMLSAVARTPFLNGGPARNHAEQSGVGRATTEGSKRWL